uniref:Beta-carotene isomerase D27-like C-terminal domain-containing protein n=1 Tax=Oryza rufipogon TaxID=4529 RepID=A0A0E0PH35_ORYRU
MAAPSPPCLLHVLLPVAASSSRGLRRRRRPTTSLLRCSSPSADTASSSWEGGREYEPSFADDFLLAFFRAKMVEEVGWDSEKPGYTGLIEVANRPMVKGKSALEIEQSASNNTFKPMAGGAMFGEFCDIIQWRIIVFVEKCKYLEESKCLGMCINTCKLPTQTFFKDHIGVDLYMEPNFEDYSCQFNFGVPPPPLDTDKALKEPCLDICTNAGRWRVLRTASVRLARRLPLHLPVAMAPPSPPCLLRALLPVASPSSRGLRRLPTTSLLRCSSPSADAASPSGEGGREYEPSFADDFLLAFFRAKMVEEVGWDSEKPGYNGLIEVANRLMVKGKSALETEQSAVRVLRSLFPPLLLVLFKALLAPIANGQLASMMVARATALSCQWLMGPCSVNSVILSNGKSLSSGVFVEKCKYLEESKCLGVCINTCKLPTQTFFKDHMGVDLYMEPNFEDYSCQFNFGVSPPPLGTDKALKEPCLDICTNARRRKELGTGSSTDDGNEILCSTATDMWATLTKGPDVSDFYCRRILQS